MAKRKQKIKPIVFIDRHRSRFGAEESRLMPWDPGEPQIYDEDEATYVNRPRRGIEYDPDDLPGRAEAGWEEQTSALRPRNPACARVLAVAAQVLDETSIGRSDTNCTKRGKLLLAESAGLAIGGRCVKARKTLKRAMKACKVRAKSRGLMKIVRRGVNESRLRRQGFID
jgi:hypothetical protein